MTIWEDKGQSPYRLYHQIQDFITLILTQVIRAINSSGNVSVFFLLRSWIADPASFGDGWHLQAPLLAVANRIVIRPTSSLSPNSIICHGCQPPVSTSSRMHNDCTPILPYADSFLRQLVVP